MRMNLLMLVMFFIYKVRLLNDKRLDVNIRKFKNKIYESIMEHQVEDQFYYYKNFIFDFLFIMRLMWEIREVIR